MYLCVIAFIANIVEVFNSCYDKGINMPHLPHIAIVIGTRPEAIKMIPVIQEVSAANDLRLSIISTGQHREMLEQVLHLFALRPHIDLHLMAPDQTLSSLTEKSAAY